MTFEEKRVTDFDVHRELKDDVKEIKSALTAHLVDETRDLNKLVVNIADVKGDIKTLAVRINGSLDKIEAVDRKAMERIESFMDSGLWYRRLVLALLALVVAGLISYGEDKRQIKVNTAGLAVLEEIHRGVQHIHTDVHDIQKAIK